MIKQKDLILILTIVILSGVLSYFISSALFGVPKNRETKVEVVQPISPEFAKPDTRYFNTNSIDPTQNITIGDNQNPQPFNSDAAN